MTYASHRISVDGDPLLSGGRVAADAHPHAHAAVALHAPHLSRAYTQLPQTTLRSDIHISMLSLKTILRECMCKYIDLGPLSADAVVRPRPARGLVPLLLHPHPHRLILGSDQERENTTR